MSASTFASTLDTSPSTTIEKLLANIPRLEPNGTNRAIFVMRF